MRLMALPSSTKCSGSGSLERAKKFHLLGRWCLALAVSLWGLHQGICTRCWNLNSGELLLMATPMPWYSRWSKKHFYLAVSLLFLQGLSGNEAGLQIWERKFLIPLSVKSRPLHPVQSVCTLGGALLWCLPEPEMCCFLFSTLRSSHIASPLCYWSCICSKSISSALGFPGHILYSAGRGSGRDGHSWKQGRKPLHISQAG